jgi:hypothetical protein
MFDVSQVDVPRYALDSDEASAVEPENDGLVFGGPPTGNSGELSEAGRTLLENTRQETPEANRKDAEIRAKKIVVSEEEMNQAGPEVMVEQANESQAGGMGQFEPKSNNNMTNSRVPKPALPPPPASTSEPTPLRRVRKQIHRSFRDTASNAPRQLYGLGETGNQVDAVLALAKGFGIEGNLATGFITIAAEYLAYTQKAKELAAAQKLAEAQRATAEANLRMTTLQAEAARLRAETAAASMPWYRKPLVLGLVVAGAGAVGYAGYKWYQKRKQA